MNFIYYDLIFLVLFCIFVALFLYRHRKGVKVESKIFLLYRTKFGIKFINWAGKTFPRFWNGLSYVIIGFGYLMMVGVFWLFIQSINVMISMVSLPKIPPLMPLVPYLPRAFKLPLPPFYFTYWILIILVIAITHEFAHGIIARVHKLRIKSTGFGFLGPFLAAFVEPDEKALKKSSSKAQLSILGAGSFSNLVFGVIFILILQLFFVACYEKAGITGYVYTLEQINESSIAKIGDYTFEEFLELNDTTVAEITNKTKNLQVLVKTEEGIEDSYDTYYWKTELNFQLQLIREEKLESAILYQDMPAIKAGLEGALQQIGDHKIERLDDVYGAITSYEPNDTIQVKTSEGTYAVTLASHPLNSSIAYLGIGFPQVRSLGKISGAVARISSPYFEPYTYASPKYNEEALTLIKDLLFWLVLICFSVALINMLPIGLLDGGRFIYVTTLGLTKSKRKAESVYRIASSVVIAILILMMVVWFFKI